MGRSDDFLRCSFCGKHQKEVRKLIAGPGVYICSECVQLCAEMVDDTRAPVRLGFCVAEDVIVLITSGQEVSFPITTADSDAWSRFCRCVKELQQKATETPEIRRLKADLAEAEKKEKEAAAETAALREKIAQAQAEQLAVECEVAAKDQGDNLSTKPK